jgi:outer membrane protein TolC
MALAAKSRLVCIAAGLIAGIALDATAQTDAAPTDLSLEQAVARAVELSEEVRLSKAQVDAAGTAIRTARAPGLPQLSVTGGYVRTFQSPFQSSFRAPSAPPFQPDPTAPLEERVRYLEQNAGAAALGAIGGLFSGSALPFGRAHTYSATLSGQQLLYSGGRVTAGVAAAEHTRSAAEASLTGQRADIQLQVTAAYYQALLAGELKTIAEAGLVQAQSFFEQEQLRQRAGYASDLDVLRAQVSLDNLRPQLVAAQNAADLAQLNLKRLVNIPLGDTVRLTTPLEIPTPEELAHTELDPEVLTRQKAIVAATAEQVSIQSENVRLANAARLPSLSLQMAYGGQAFPSKMFEFSSAIWQPDWTATLGFSLPLFTGFEAEATIARARVAERQAELQLAQVREAVELQYEQARGEKERARASIGARQRTVEQAQRVYDLTVLRYGQGQSTQLEVSQARLELLQSRSNLAQAIADFYLAGAGVSNAQAGTSAQTMTPSSTSEQMSGSAPPRATSGAATTRQPTGGTPR